MEAIILAGGKGTRLRAVVSDIPKPMASVAGKPFLEYILKRLIKVGFTHAVLSVGYRHEVITKYFGDDFNGLSIDYFKEDKPLLTGGAIKASLSLCRENRVFVLNGDTFFDVDYNKMQTLSEKTNAPLVMAVKKMYDFDRYGSLEIKDDYIASFREKEYSKEGYINGGIYLIKKNALDNVDKEEFSFEVDFAQKFCGKLKIPVFYSDGYFIDIGIPEDYKKAEREIMFME